MDGPRIVIADEDEKYLTPLVNRILEMTGPDIMPEIITQEQRCREFFRTGRSIDLLVLGKPEWLPERRYHQIRAVVLFTEDQQDNRSSGEGDIVKIYRFSRLQTITNLIFSFLKGEKKGAQEKTDILCVTSAAGGAGKTLTALAVAAELNQAGGRTLYLDAEQLQSFDVYLDDAQRLLPREAIELFGSKDMEKLADHIRQDGELEYLKGSDVSLMSLGREKDVYAQLLEKLKEDGRYRYIVVDTDSVPDSFKAELLSRSSKVIFVTVPGRAAQARLERYWNNLNIDFQKCYFVCNMASKEQKRYMWTASGDQIRYTSMLPAVSPDGDGLLNSFRQEPELRSLVYMML